MPRTKQPSRDSLASKVADALKERILSWQYPPKQRLIEEDICAEFNVSRSPAREALARLAAHGLLDHAPRRGYTVRRLDMKTITDLYELRLALETFVAESLAKTRRDDPELANLRQTWTALTAHPDALIAGHDRSFHETLAGILGNDVLSDQLTAINERLTVFRQFDFLAPKRAASTCNQHLAILDAILAGDPDAARQGMAANIRDGLANVENAVAALALRAYS